MRWRRATLHEKESPWNGRILVVDDEPGMRDMVELELGERGHDVVTAADGLEAIARIEETDFDLVISDVRMPGADGIRVLRTAKSSAPDIEVIVISGYAEVESAIECVREGAFDLIRKPFHLADFLSSVDRALEHRHLRITAILYRASQEIMEGDGEQPLGERIATTAMRLLEADDASVMLLDTSDSLRIVYATSIPEAIQAETRLALGERVAGRVALDRSPALLPEALSDDPRFEGLQSHGRVRSGIIYPLIHRDRVLGVINLNRIHSRRRFRKGDLDTLGVISAQAALAVRNERLMQHLVTSERLAAVGQLAAGILHEINNPLTFIMGNTALARETLRSLPRDTGGRQVVSKEDAQDIQQSLSDIDAGVDRLKDIVADMRGLSRKDENPDERFDVNDPIRSAIRIGGPTVRRQAHVTTKFGEDLEVVGSSGRLSQVFLNLLVNAAHALDATGRTDGRIHVHSRRNGASVVVDVTDDGPGIPPAHLSRIVEPFYTTKPKDHGSGLGLSISRDIVVQHGGELRVRSEVGTGTTFTVVLPAAEPARREEPETGRASTTERPGEMEVRPARILCVDDEPAIRRAIERILGRRFEVRLAEDGARAFEILQNDRAFGAIVSDIAMPRMTGTELYRQVKKSWPELAARIVFVTGAVLDTCEQEFLQREDVRVLRKPVQFSELTAVMEGVVASKCP